MKKKTFAVVITLIMVVSVALTACGGKNDSSEPEGEPVVEEAEEAEETPAEITVKVNYDGKTEDIVVTEGSTVADAISTAKITLGNDDLVSPEKSKALSDKAEITITRVTYEEEEEIIEVPYETEYVPDNGMYEGNSYYVQYGVVGETVNTYRRVFHDGEEVDRELVNTEIRVEVQNEIVAYGTVPVPAATEEPVTCEEGADTW